jgi:hypothetical protein
MARATWLLGVITVASVSSSLWLYLDNRSLRGELAAQSLAAAKPAAATPVATAAARPVERSAPPQRTVAPVAPTAAGPAPSLPEAPRETRLDRRARRTEEFAAQFGRLDGETEDEYRARVLPLISAGLIAPRMRAEEQRRVAQEKANVTPEQSARLDKAFDKVYGDLLDYTNKAVTDGQLSPYERNVSGWLEYAGGLGGILTEANGQIGKILEPSQVRAMYDSGFEWGEYLGLKAPWEQLKPPPPPRK